MTRSLVPTPETTSDRPPRATAELRGTPRTAGKFEFTLQVSLIAQPICAAVPAIRSYELVVAGDSDADAGTP
ncbi:MAG TPA: hypothetical protein VJV78_33755 [Polyangiales bacterium]|nr:hypothetical protein [Polyangiales bacterium]